MTIDPPIQKTYNTTLVEITSGKPKVIIDEDVITQMTKLKYLEPVI